ncbi:MAG TPA: 3'-5' exonuclease, partial [Candidatus Melainabacteria bacterium]|nr:3'-5' exonuclease [Candidatus Melainabacteria bacterium]
GEKTRLFLIGDDKQSIYKFQGADVSNFNEWKNALCGSPSSVTIDFLQGEKNVIPLNKSFRSHPDLVNGVNAIFAELLDPGADPQIYRASFESLDAHRERVVDTERTEVLFFDSSSTENAEQKKSFETELICQWIEEKVRLQMPIQLKDGSASRPAKFGDFAILVQKNDHFAPLEEALTRHAIPFVTLGGKSFLMRQEVFDIENLLRFLDNEFDSHSLLGALRSPLFSITDDIIHQLVTDAGNPRNPHLWEMLCQVSDEKRPGFEVCRQAVAHLRKLKESAQLRPLGELIREILSLTDYDTVLLSSKNGRQRSRNVWKLVQLATGNESLSPGEFARRLSLMREHRVKQADAPLQTDDVVKLMTIHASKGLEFPVVILPFLSSKIDPRHKKLLFHKQYGIALNTDRSVSASREKDQNTPSWFQLAKLVDNDMEAEEKKRLLYVAMTRPRDHLALFIDAQQSRFNSFSTWLFDHVVPSDYAGEERISFDLGPNSKVAIRRYEPVAKLPAEVASLSLIEELDEAKKLLRLDLIEPILDSDAVLRAPTSRRITPGKDGVRLEATLVGTYFHSLMEHMLTRLEKPQSWLLEEVALAQGDWASHPEVVSHLVRQGERWMEKFCDSDLFLLMKNARRRLHEIPYFSYVDEGLEDKRPDLLIEDKDGEWHLVDYKIDSFPISEIDAQAAEHLPQMLGYVRDLRSITGINCTAHLFFANHGVLHKLKAEVLST